VRVLIDSRAGVIRTQVSRRLVVWPDVLWKGSSSALKNATECGTKLIFANRADDKIVRATSAGLRDNGINMEKATFGAGCFWGVEAAFRQLKGVVSTAVGYSGGHFPNPTYKDVCSGKTGHAEVVQVEYEPTQVTYDDLLKVFWENHDPTTLNRQGPDVGAQYRSAIFFHTPEQESAAKASKEKMQAGYKKKIVTEITPASEFYRAEDYHQQYLEKRGLAHCAIR
jgi:peptide-methionine (S)-S-oxide reductase